MTIEAGQQLHDRQIAVNDERLRRWAAEWSAIWEVPQLLDRVEVCFNRRLRRSLGRCDVISGQVSLHPSLKRGPVARLREVLCHELAHMAVGWKERRRVRPHGTEWGRLMQAAGYAPRARMSLDKMPPDLRKALQPRLLYRHSCPVCSASRLARRAMRAWRCRRCCEAGLKGEVDIVTTPRSGE